MNAEAILQAELMQRGILSVDELTDDELIEVAIRFSIWLPRETYSAAPWLAPFAVRSIRIRTDAHAPGPKRDLWGLPNEMGYFTDDNSLLKKIPIGKRIASKSGPYGNQRPAKGLVCCHVWAKSTKNPLLFSFVPNLVWLPRQLARFSDNHLAGPPHALHDRLKAISRDRYCGVTVAVARGRAQLAWEHLEFMPTETAVCNEVIDDGRIVALVEQRMSRLEAFIESTLLRDSPPPDRFSKRYHAGTGARIDRSVDPIYEIVELDRRRTFLDEMRSCNPSRRT